MLDKEDDRHLCLRPHAEGPDFLHFRMRCGGLILHRKALWIENPHLCAQPLKDPAATEYVLEWLFAIFTEPKLTFVVLERSHMATLIRHTVRIQRPAAWSSYAAVVIRTAPEPSKVPLRPHPPCGELRPALRAGPSRMRRPRH